MQIIQFGQPLAKRKVLLNIFSAKYLENCKLNIILVFDAGRVGVVGGEGGGGDITLVAVTINPWWGWTSTNTSFLSNNAPAHTGSAESSDILVK